MFSAMFLIGAALFKSYFIEFFWNMNYYIKNSILYFPRRLNPPWRKIILKNIAESHGSDNLLNTFSLKTCRKRNAVHFYLKCRFLLHMKFHWQYFITYSCFRLFNILLRKSDTSPKTKMKMIKTIFWMKNNKKCQDSICKYKVAFFIVTSRH